MTGNLSYFLDNIPFFKNTFISFDMNRYYHLHMLLIENDKIKEVE